MIKVSGVYTHTMNENKMNSFDARQMLGTSPGPMYINDKGRNENDHIHMMQTRA